MATAPASPPPKRRCAAAVHFSPGAARTTQDLAEFGSWKGKPPWGKGTTTVPVYSDLAEQTSIQRALTIIYTNKELANCCAAIASCKPKKCASSLLAPTTSGRVR